MLLTWLTIFIILFELWYLAAFLFAFIRLRDRTLLLQVGQGLLLLGAFCYIAIVAFRQQQFNPFIFGIPIVGAMLLSLLWRRSPGSLPRFARSYPRGIADVLAFRRPKAIDLKRRVRTK